ncbi:MAG: hypothetical protein A3C36_04345 [Omnitrophica WOR_2 bacterium RIFCSPHIGHO2_02_FULL_52_10]|nr:MAG: hypothetical protein A3C36_04345 [Omnitrophica WOR_2 bacterium RIFCSPHIGHO2_02_FULL_52_10]
MSQKKLISRLRRLLEEIERYETDGEAARAVMKVYWTAGKDVHTYTRETGEIIKNIAHLAGVAKGTLEKYVRFYRQYPGGYREDIDGCPLKWSHYAALLYAGDKKVREFYLQNTALHGWSSHELRRRMRNNFYENTAVQGQKSKGGTKLKMITQRLYTYAADVLKVTDGDTFFLNIDVGFYTKMEHKVRLRGINCPEKGTKKGEEAKAFVEKELAAKIVVIRSYKSMTEKFGRYLVDLWYLPGETDKERILAEGRWLNQVLLDKGLAHKVE